MDWKKLSDEEGGPLGSSGIRGPAVVRKRIRRYGIPVAMVSIATGGAMLFPTISPTALVVIYLAAVLASTLKVGWKSGITSMLASFATLTIGFSTHAGASAAFLVFSLIAIGASELRRNGFPAGSAPEEDLLGETATHEEQQRLRFQKEAVEPPSAFLTHTWTWTGTSWARQHSVTSPEAEAHEQVIGSESSEREVDGEDPTATEEPVAADPSERARPERDLDRAPEGEEHAKPLHGIDQDFSAGERLATLEREKEELARRLTEERAQARRDVEKALEDRYAAERAARAETETKRALEERLAAERLELLTREQAERATAEQAAEERRSADRQERENLVRERDRLAQELEERAAGTLTDESQRAAEERLATLEREKEELTRRLTEERDQARREAEIALEERAAQRAAREQAEVQRAAAEQLAAERLTFSQQLQEERSAVERAADERLAAAREVRERVERERDYLAQQLQALAAAPRAGDQPGEERASSEPPAVPLGQRDQPALSTAEPLPPSVEPGSTLPPPPAESESEQAEEPRPAEEPERHEVNRGQPPAQFDERVAVERAARETLAKLERERSGLSRPLTTPRPTGAKGNVAPPPTTLFGQSGIFSTLSSWLKSPPPTRSGVNLKTKKLSVNQAPKRRVNPATSPRRRVVQKEERRPRILMLERRRATADAIAPRLRAMGIDIQIVERWIDAGDELVRFSPDAIFVDAELSDFTKIHQSIVQQAPQLPILVTAGAHGALPWLPRAASLLRPYNAEAIAKIARESMTSPEHLLDHQHAPAVTTLPGNGPPAPYNVECFNCHVDFDATSAEWCSCLTKARTLVCTNCLGCFCKAPASYKEKFWLEAPPHLFERKFAELGKQRASSAPNQAPDQVKRPLVLLVEDDRDNQAIVQRVCLSLGYGFVSASNGQDGLALAPLYRPDLILSEALMPRLDGREMCRILKEEGDVLDCKMIVMTGLYTDTKYKTEALKRFHLDDYLSKPVAVTTLVDLLQKHLGGTPYGVAAAEEQELRRNELDTRRPSEPLSFEGPSLMEGPLGSPHYGVEEADIRELLHNELEPSPSRDDLSDEEQSLMEEPLEGSHYGVEEADVQELQHNELEPSPSRDDLSDEEQSLMEELFDTTESQSLTVEASTDSEPPHEVACFTCGKNFDAMKAKWCSKPGHDQTLVCPHCKTCFCDSTSYKEWFWKDAPAALFERKLIASGKVEGTPTRRSKG